MEDKGEVRNVPPPIILKIWKGTQLFYILVIYQQIHQLKGLYDVELAAQPIQ